MDRQAIFNTVKAHLLAQGRKAEREGYDGYPGCVYRADNGDKCAVGCLIPDDLYSPKMEGTKARQLIAENEALARHLGISKEEDGGYPEREFIQSLQHIHDNRDPSNWSAALDTFAVEHELSAA